MSPAEFRRTALQTAIFSTVTFGVEYSFQLVDIYWISRLGSGAPTAIAIISSIFFLLFSFNEIIGVSSSALLSQAFGKGDRQKTGFAIFQTLLLKCALGIITAIIFILSLRLIVRYYDLSDAEIHYIQEYGSIIWISAILLPIYASLMTALRCLKLAHLSACFGITAFILNLIINPVLIFGYGVIPAMGIKGAAWATVIAQSCAMSLCLYALINNKYQIVIFDWKYLVWKPVLYKKLVLIGLPYMGIMGLYNIEQTILPALLATFPSEISDGYSIGSRIMGLLFMMSFGLSTGIIVAIGHALGNKQTDLIKQQLPIVLCYMIGILSGVSVLLFLFSEHIALIFTQQPTSVQVAANFLKYMAITQLGIGIMYLFNGVFEGAGRNMPSLIGAIIMFGLFEFPVLGYLWLSGPLDLQTIWIVIATTSVIGAGLMSNYYRKGVWQNGISFHD